MTKVSSSALDPVAYRREHEARKSKFLSKRMFIDTAMWLDVGINSLSAYALHYAYLRNYLDNPMDVALYSYFSFSIVVCLYFGLKRISYYESLGAANEKQTYFSLGRTIVFCFLIPLFVLFLLKTSATVSRVWFLSWMCCVFITLIATRRFWRWFIGASAASGYFSHKIVLVGSSGPLERATALLSEAERAREIQLLSICDLAQESGDLTPRPGHGKVLQLDRMLNDCRTQSIDEVIIAVPPDEPALLDKVRRTLSLLPVEVSIFFDLSSDLKLHGIKTVCALQAISVQRSPITEWGRFAKCVADYTISATAIAFLFPVLVLIAIAIKLDSRGPVLFEQRRQGLNGRIIKVLKFRTMSVMEDGDTVSQARRHDQRNTRVGRVLRRTSFDELPQFLNVLTGEMSVVGPRPHAIAHNTYYENLLENYANRYRVKPGITGWAQINGFRGEISDPKQMENRVKFDIEYIDNWNFWTDLYIMLVTPVFGLFSRKAY
jgi:Undecaprenyl-phosphate glucose phosphotransferase